MPAITVLRASRLWTTQKTFSVLQAAPSLR
jgi:hypothetical protein